MKVPLREPSTSQGEDDQHRDRRRTGSSREITVDRRERVQLLGLAYPQESTNLLLEQSRVLKHQMPGGAVPHALEPANRGADGGRFSPQYAFDLPGKSRRVLLPHSE